jgi:hypothetical protein
LERLSTVQGDEAAAEGGATSATAIDENEMVSGFMLKTIGLKEGLYTNFIYTKMIVDTARMYTLYPLWSAKLD